MSKTVAFFNGFYLPHLGGVERYTYNIAKKLLEKGYRVIVVTTQDDETLKNEEVLEGIKVYRLPIKNIWKSRYPFFKKNKTYHDLIAKIEAEQIDYFVANTRFHLAAILGTKMAKKQGKEALVLEHGTTYLTLNNPVLDFFLKRIERALIGQVKKNSSIFYGVSKEAADWIKVFGIQSKGVLYNAVDSDDLAKYLKEEKKDKIVISYSGRLQAKFKGVETLLSAFTKISQEFPNLELVIAGDGPIFEEMKASYPQENISFLGYVSHDEVMKLNNKSDIFVLLSKIEGFSTSMIEAALLENVVITTNVGGAHELIPSDEYGFVIENSEEALLTSLRQLLNQPEKIKSIQENVSKRVLENFTWDKTAEAFIDAFGEMK
ncbi:MULTISPECIES: glycosyltransferase family 4 protein [unclassified Lactococcus]|uniref:glycosyltransferase family 4 protein n=1 Tax=unclassified Lactococcus TaxID=2643510 RepID=UPI0011CAE518|nr:MULTISPECIES: glycosyltransferase family 4 protein [unclassified Lactococcus]MQW22818.1 glycosyltransferase [Lactococcus sp. dk101]TXK44821.1 glycosyltransferase family 4 protein [Lactococcus sp. dk310]TXK50715.1 glycosyltransferase family 4 protein [Lactococcus sp. dk322]